MIIFFIPMEQHSQEHEFTFHSPSLESGLETVNLIASQGGQLLVVQILDEFSWRFYLRNSCGLLPKRPKH